jgi:hypothetical protein
VFGDEEIVKGGRYLNGKVAVGGRYRYDVLALAAQDHAPVLPLSGEIHAVSMVSGAALPTVTSRSPRATADTTGLLEADDRMVLTGGAKSAFKPSIRTTTQCTN